jgi:5-methylcytosine-specific restriction endonuclease McrA
MHAGIERFRGRMKKQRQTVMRQDWRRKKWKAQKGNCFYCSDPMLLEPQKYQAHKLCTLDHLIPLSRGGRDHWENVVAACHKCNQTKRARTADEFKAEEARIR